METDVEVNVVIGCFSSKTKVFLGRLHYVRRKNTANRLKIFKKKSSGKAVFFPALYACKDKRDY